MTKQKNNSVNLHLEDVGVDVGTTRILDGVNLSVHEGDRIAICGGSGVGKTTLLRTIALLSPLTSGSLSFDGQLIAHANDGRCEILVDENAYRIRVGMVFQSFDLWANKTVLENVTEGPRYVKGLSRKKAQELAEQICDRLDIENQIHKYPNELSGGQRQRVALARCLAMEPEVLLLDEITSALDPPLAADVLWYLEQELTEVTLLIVTHYMEFARRLANRFVFLHARNQDEPGRVVIDDSLEKLDEFLSGVPEFADYLKPMGRLH